ncbi:MAG: hypothetical protein LWY06_01180 [Firmicutes bacterium]|nr:hypothetical protein [Bacillota bacterium]
MAIKNRFEDREWKLLSSLPAWTAMGILAVEGGIINYIRGFVEIGKMIENFQREFSGSQLIMTILADYNSKKDNSVRQEPEQFNDEDIYQVEETEAGEYTQNISEMNIISGKPFPMSELLQKCRQAVFIAESKIGVDETSAFKKFIVKIAEIMANASGSGFLGLGERLSPKEKDAIRDIKKALNFEQA